MNQPPTTTVVPVRHDRGLIRTAIGEALQNLGKRPTQAAMLLLSVAIGVALALAIIAAGRSVQDKITLLLAIEPPPPQINFLEIEGVLNQARTLLTQLAFAFTAVLVGAVTWLSISRRRREIGIKRQFGLHVQEVLVELWVEATILCFVGGLTGVFFGYLLCNWIHTRLPALPMTLKVTDVLLVFPIVVTLSFVATAVVASYFAIFPTSETEL